uniref:Uncharacterized protein n=1 Tax=Oryza sativa subsp. japonica TaxID=39947 RepID=Q75KA3_ORYSJ|nr:hypothetical protein [Oryza sativa Japonica Group]
MREGYTVTACQDAFIIFIYPCVSELKKGARERLLALPNASRQKLLLDHGDKLLQDHDAPFGTAPAPNSNLPRAGAVPNGWRRRSTGSAAACGLAAARGLGGGVRGRQRGGWPTVRGLGGDAGAGRRAAAQGLAGSARPGGGTGAGRRRAGSAAARGLGGDAGAGRRAAAQGLAGSARPGGGTGAGRRRAGSAAARGLGGDAGAGRLAAARGLAG